MIEVMAYFRRLTVFLNAILIYSNLLKIIMDRGVNLQLILNQFRFDFALNTDPTMN